MAATAHDLADLLDLPCCECFNADDEHPLRNALAAESRDDASLLLESDVDEGAQKRCATRGRSVASNSRAARRRAACHPQVPPAREGLVDRD